MYDLSTRCTIPGQSPLVVYCTMSHREGSIMWFAIWVGIVVQSYKVTDLTSVGLSKRGRGAAQVGSARRLGVHGIMYCGKRGQGGSRRGLLAGVARHRQQQRDKHSLSLVLRASRAHAAVALPGTATGGAVADVAWPSWQHDLAQGRAPVEGSFSNLGEVGWQRDLAQVVHPGMANISISVRLGNHR